MTRCLLALGSNLGDRSAMLCEAVRAIARLPGCQVIARSRWHETVPIGGPVGQGAFLNGALLLETQIAPNTLCESLLRIESMLGRQRAVRWDARAIDIDILLYGAEKIATPELVVPHLRMSFRRFVLEPAAEIAGAMVHSTIGWTMAALLSHITTAPRYVAITARQAEVADWLAGQIAAELNCPRLEDTQPKTSAQGANIAVGPVESIGLLRKSHWQAVPLLSARLPGGQSWGDQGEPPVVSGFWSGGWAGLDERDSSFLNCLVGDGQVIPALVIAVEPGKSEEFSKKIFLENHKKNFVLPGLSRQEFGKLLDQPGLGPVARIQSEDPEVVVQEARAAVSSVWS